MIPSITYFFLLSAPILYGLTNVLLKKGVKNVPPFASMAISMATLLLLASIGTLIFEKSYWTNSSIDKKGITTLVLAGSCNFIAFWFLLKSYQHVPVWKYQMFSLLIPVFSSLFAYFLLGENFSVKMLIGLSIVCLGVFIAIR